MGASFRSKLHDHDDDSDIARNISFFFFLVNFLFVCLFDSLISHFSFLF